MGQLHRDLVPWTARDVAERCDLYPAEIREALVQVAEYTDRRLHNQRQALIDLLTTDRPPDWTTVSRVFTGSYEKPLPFVQERVIPALKIIRRNATGLIETPVFCEITRCLDLWSEMHVMAEIIGGAGRSKTVAAREWHLSHPDSIYLDCPAVGGAGAFLRELATELQIGTSATLDKLAVAIETRIDKRNVLIVDEIARILPTSANPHGPGVKTLNFLQRLHDRQGVTVIFVATDIFDETFNQLGLIRYLAQLHRRILFRYQIPAVDNREIACIVRAFNPEASVDLLREAKALGSGPDGVGPLFAYLNNARLLADEAGVPVDVEHLRESAKYSKDRGGRAA